MKYKFEDERHNPLEVIIRLLEYMDFEIHGQELNLANGHGSVQSQLVYAYFWLSNELQYGRMWNYYESGREGIQYKFFLNALDLLLENHSDPFDKGDLAYLAKCKQGVMDDMSLNLFECNIKHGEKLSGKERKVIDQLRKTAIDLEEILCDWSSNYASYPAFVLNYCLKNPVLFDRQGARIELPGTGTLRKFFETEGLWDQGSYENKIPNCKVTTSAPSYRKSSTTFIIEGNSNMASSNQPPLDTTNKSQHKKSRPIMRDWASGNEPKYFSYREAWARIKLASKMKFYLEAVTIEESIISDRMLSFLEKQCGVVLGGHSLSNTSKVWLTHATNLVGAESEAGIQAKELFTKINAWREHRNKVVHGIVKSKAPRHEDHIDNFLEEAAAAAGEGEKVARAIDRWVAKAKPQVT